MKKCWCVALICLLAVLWSFGAYSAETSENKAADQKAVQDKDQKHETKKDTKKNQEESFVLEAVEVTGKPPREGSAEAGYRVNTVSAGPLGDKKPLDLPYQINAVSGDLMNNLHMTSFKEVVKLLPSTQIEARGGLDLGRPQTRGMEGSVSENNRMDGMNIAITTAYPMEQFERVEVLNGLAGSLYGPASPAGVFNYILKRPTDTPQYILDVSYGTQKHADYHMDLSGPVNEKFGYRINAVYGDGEGYADDSNLRRKLISLAFDWRILARTVLELNYSYYDYTATGFPGGFSYSSSTSLPDAPDPTRKGYGQSWAGLSLTTTTASFKVKHDFNKDWHLTAGYLDQEANRDMFSITNTFTNNAGRYRTSFSPSSGSWLVNSEMLYLNGRVQTWGINHDLSLGTNGHERRMKSSVNSWAVPTIWGTTSANTHTGTLDSPTSWDEPSWWIGGPRYLASSQRQQAVTVGDTLTFNKSWSALISASQSWLRSHSYNSAGKTTASPHDSGVSTFGSLMYKPLDNMTAYVSYGDSIQQGDTAASTNVNAYEVLAPYRSKQYEAGLKATVKKMDLSSAVFRLERPMAYAGTDNVFREQGDQVNYGLELMASGEIINRVTVYAGATFLDPKLKDTYSASTSDKRVVGVPKEQGNLYVEYRMPFIDGLTPCGNLHYTSHRAANDTNTTWASGYTTIDLGVRYARKIMGVDTTWRLMVTNLTDEHYWASIFPGNINGTNGSASAFIGAPREIVASMQFKF